MKSAFGRISFLLIVLFFTSCASQDQSTPPIDETPQFPHISDIEIEFFQTEVTVTDEFQQTTGLATEYYDNSVPRGRVDLIVLGNRQSIFYTDSKDAGEIIDANSTTCSASDVDTSLDDYFPVFYGWLNKDPLVIGPSAPLFFAQNYRSKLISEGAEEIRGIRCYKWSLHIENNRENITYYYYFAADSWTTPYQFSSRLMDPIRIEIKGESSKYSAKADQWAPIGLITDFAYFKPTIDDWRIFQPPAGLGCTGKKSADDMPQFPKSFMYAAEMLDLLKADSSDVADIEYQRVWFDEGRMLSRLDHYSRARYLSELYDFKMGVTYSIVNGQTCVIKPLRNSMFEAYDGKIIGHMKEAKEVLNLDGTFYSLGNKLIRGIWTDVYESVVQDVVFMDKSLRKLVITIYFSKAYYKAAVSGETEQRIPIFYMVTGYDTPTNVALKIQCNIFGFDDVIWPEMYESFRLAQCFPSMNDKSYFLLLMDASDKLAAKLEQYDDIVKEEIRAQIAKYGKVSDMRLPILNVDYKTNGVYATGLLLDRPPALKQFFMEFEGEVPIQDKYLKPAVEADTQEKCANACVDNDDFTCTGFYWCKQACFLKSKDLLDPDEDGGDKIDLGESCQTWMRATRDSLNTEKYLFDALQSVEKAIINGDFSLSVRVDENTAYDVPVTDIVIGDGPYIGNDNTTKPYNIAIKFAKLKSTADTTTSASYVDTLTDCYSACKNAEGTSCASFSYCPDSDKKDCRISSVLVVDRKTNTDDTEDDKNCYVYSLQYVDLYTEFPGRTLLIGGEDVLNQVTSANQCARACREEKRFECRGFEYCWNAKTCVLHSKHVLDLKPGDYSDDKKATCTHYSAKFSADYRDSGLTLIDDSNDVRSELSLEQCARACSEELKDDCKSFNYCPASAPYATDSSCALIGKGLLDSGVTTTKKDKCRHYEKKSNVDDWSKGSAQLVTAGYTKKGFTGVVIGLLALGLIIGAVGFVLFSYFRSKNSGEGMSVRFMKSDI